MQSLTRDQMRLVPRYRVLLTEWGEQQTGRLRDELFSGKVLQTVSSGE